jgi:hypothetical protein
MLGAEHPMLACELESSTSNDQIGSTADGATTDSMNFGQKCDIGRYGRRPRPGRPDGPLPSA